MILKKSKMKAKTMRIKDVVELIRVDMPDHTDGAFNVKIESDDGGTHIVIFIENHSDGQDVLRAFSNRFSDQRVIIMLVPSGSIHPDNRE